MRKYQPAWNKLKKDPSQPLVISAHKDLHARIYKAIMKEKNIDLVFHLEMDMAGFTTQLRHKSEGNALKIFLKLYPNFTVEGLFE